VLSKSKETVTNFLVLLCLLNQTLRQLPISIVTIDAIFGDETGKNGLVRSLCATLVTNFCFLGKKVHSWTKAGCLVLALGITGVENNAIHGKEIAMKS
jgi:hypothetical protein